MVTRYWPDDRGVVIRFSAGEKDSSPIKNGETGSRAHPATYSVSTRCLSLGLKRPGHEVTSYLSLVPKLRMCEVVPLFPRVASWRKYREAF